MILSKSLYLDHQATTPVNKRILEKMLPFLTENFGNPHSTDHSVGWKMSQVINDAKTSIADMIGAGPDEIVFTSGATESNNLALLGLGKHETGGNRRRILVSAIEHKCILTIARTLVEQYGYTIDVLPVDKEGRVSVSELTDKLDEDVLFVSIMAVNNEIGTVQDIPALSAVAKEAGATFHCDAAQAPIAINLRNYADAVDLISLSGHKMLAPQGIGALYIRRDLQSSIEPLQYGGGQQNGLRSGTLPVALCVGMGAAADILRDHETETARENLRRLRNSFIDQLNDLPWEVSLNGPVDLDRHPGNANMCFHKFSAHDILQILQPHVAASTGSACTTGIPEPSHVLKAIGLSGEDADASIRFSLGFHTTDEDIAQAVGLIGNALERLTKTACSA